MALDPALVAKSAQACGRRWSLCNCVGASAILTRVVGDSHCPLVAVRRRRRFMLPRRRAGQGRHMTRKIPSLWGRWSTFGDKRPVSTSSWNLVAPLVWRNGP
jgi:hypothetical protein